MADSTRVEPQRGGLDMPRLTMGLFLVAFGLVFLFDRFFWIDGFELFRLWPVWLIAFGIIRVAFPGRGRSRLSGFWPILIGFIFVLDTFRIMSINDSWPLFIVGGGLLMMLRATGVGRCCPGDERTSS